MKLLLIDTDPAYIALIQAAFPDVVVNDPTAAADVAIVDEKYLCRPRCRFVTVSNSQTEKGMKRAFLMGATDYVAKTFEVDKIKATLKWTD